MVELTDPAAGRGESRYGLRGAEPSATGGTETDWPQRHRVTEKSQNSLCLLWGILRVSQPVGRLLPWAAVSGILLVR